MTHASASIPDAGLPVWQAALLPRFGDRLQMAAPLARYTAARIGGPADGLLEVRSADELAEAVAALWAAHAPFVILGGGSNVLVADAGVRGVVLVNRAKAVRFGEDAQGPTVWAESGANFGALARQAAQRGLSGLEWAGGIPGTVGGAVVGNAGAHGGDMAGNLIVAEILHDTQQATPTRETWPVEQLEYDYRTSRLKMHPGDTIVLSATLRLQPGTPEAVQATMERFVEQRRRTQPPGASMGSMFKNPPGDWSAAQLTAGRLIEQAGLKGLRTGDAEISPLHGNFFINHGQATAADVLRLLRQARQKVAEQSGVELELEVELVGEFESTL